MGVALPTYLPTVELTPDGFGAKLAKLVGAQDIQFESEDFNRAFRVASSDPEVAHAIVHPRLMERMLRDDALGSAWRIEGTWILTWAAGSTDLDRLVSRLGLLARSCGRSRGTCGSTTGSTRGRLRRDRYDRLTDPSPEEPA